MVNPPKVSAKLIREIPFDIPVLFQDSDKAPVGPRVAGACQRKPYRCESQKQILVDPISGKSIPVVFVTKRMRE